MNGNKDGRVAEVCVADEEDSSQNSNTSHSSSSNSSFSQLSGDAAQDDDDEDLIADSMKINRMSSRFTHDSGQIIEAAVVDEMDEITVAATTTTTSSNMIVPQALSTTTVLLKDNNFNQSSSAHSMIQVDKLKSHSDHSSDCNIEETKNQKS